LTFESSYENNKQNSTNENGTAGKKSIFRNFKILGKAMPYTTNRALTDT